MKARLVQLIDLMTSKHRRFKELEELTGVSSDSWRMFYSGKQRATEEMIEKICCAFPKLALWITTGEAKPEHEQYDAETLALLKKYHLALIVEKEPISATDEEMVVVTAEMKRIEYISDNADFAKYYYYAIAKFLHTRDLGITTQELAKREWERDQKTMAENILNRETEITSKKK